VLEAVRDEWLQPLIDQLRAVERDLGRTEAERDQERKDKEDERQAQVTAEAERDKALKEADGLRKELDHLRETGAAQDVPQEHEG
jgi:uncharacterized sporulation protein YeaH/YhbH (DUF444 family)